jgi:hypothetical protein
MPQCIWDAVEVILKASLATHEDALLQAWIRGYLEAFVCYPRLHVITNESATARAAQVFQGVPNVSVRANQFPPRVVEGGNIAIIQWHLFWADNFTSAPHVLCFDVDSVPILPLCCSQLFDTDGRVLLHAWRHPHPTKWVASCSHILWEATRRNEALATTFTPLLASLDFWTFFPVVAPRWLLPHVRRLVRMAFDDTYFDDAYVRMRYPAHADLIAKTAISLFPEAVRVVLCPSTHNRSLRSAVQEVQQLDAALTRGGRTRSPLPAGRGFECHTHVNTVEHVRHPQQDLHSPSMGVRFMNYTRASRYANELLDQAVSFRRGEAPLPAKLVHYRVAHAAAASSFTCLRQSSHELPSAGPGAGQCGVVPKQQ